MSDSTLQIRVLQIHPDALSASGLPPAEAELCPASNSSWLRVRVLPTLGVRNAARTSRAADGLLTMRPEDCAPGSGPGLYAAGDFTKGGLGLEAEDVQASGDTCALTSIAHELRPSMATAGLALSTLAAGTRFSIAISTDGGVFVWGNPHHGLVDGISLPSIPTQMALPLGARAVALAAGDAHALVLVDDGRVFGLGSDEYGQLGGLNTTGWGQMSQIGSLPPARAITAGAKHSIVLANASDDLYAFGFNDGGQLGLVGTTQQVATPTRLQVSLPDWISPDETIVSVTTGLHHTVVALESGLICAWGSNTYGQLGPVDLPAAAAAAASTLGGGITRAPCFNITSEFGLRIRIRLLAAGGHHSLAVSTEGRLFAWGRSVGAVGLDSDAGDDPTVPRTPLEADGGPGMGAYVHTAAAGTHHSIATTAGGDVWSWGGNEFGQLGVGCGAGSMAMTRPPALTVGISPTITSAWRAVGDAAPATWSILDLGTSTVAGISAVLNTVIEPAYPTLVSVAGSVAPCRAACEAHAAAAAASTGTSAFGACGGFTVPTLLPAATQRLTWEDCTFYSMPASSSASARSTSVATVRTSGVKLYLHDRNSLGNAAAAAAGASHSLVAVGLRPTDRCPLSGPAHQPCGGASQGQCLYGMCVCEPGWTGDGCTEQACSPACHPERGTCTASGDQATCQCMAGWTGVQCTELDCPRFGGIGCSGRGTCYLGAADARLCNCESGWGGSACEFPSCGTAPLNSCSNRGVCACVPTASDPAPRGDLPITSCAGANRTQQCECSGGYAGADCTITCPRGASGDVCGFHGTCVADAAAAANSSGTAFAGGVRCVCDAGWSGQLCEVPVCPGFPECNGRSRGECVRTSSGATCQCYIGFQGAACDALACPSDCSGNGVCQLSSEGSPQCACAYGFGGGDCATNTGLSSVFISGAIAAGVLLLAGCVFLAVYCSRQRSTGQSVGPTAAYRQRMWTHASNGPLGHSVAIHTPKRVSSTRAVRVRVAP